MSEPRTITLPPLFSTPVRPALHQYTPSALPSDPQQIRTILNGRSNQRWFTGFLAPLIPHGPALLTFSDATGHFGPLHFMSRPAGTHAHTHPDDTLLVASELDSEEEFTCMVSNAAGDCRVYPGALDLLHERLTRDGRIHQLTAQAAVEYLNARMYGLFDTPGGHSELHLDDLRTITDTQLNVTVSLRHSGGHEVKLLLRVDTTERPELRLSKVQHPEPIALNGLTPSRPVQWNAKYAQAFRAAAQQA